MQKVFELRSFGLAQRVLFGEIPEMSDAGLRLFRRTECIDLPGSLSGHNKIDDLVAGSCREHDRCICKSFQSGVHS